jgi:hypothetical protein
MRNTIDMAREAEIGDSHGYIIAHELAHLKAFEALVRADEREACADICEDTSQEYEQYTGQPQALNYTCAAAIRARGETK